MDEFARGPARDPGRGPGGNRVRLPDRSAKDPELDGAEATTDAYPGGLYLVKDIAGRPGRTAGGSSAVVPVHRLAYSFGWEGDVDVPPGRACSRSTSSNGTAGRWWA